jgi:hypothetical protein
MDCDPVSEITHAATLKFLERWITTYGPPGHKFVFDRGSEFNNAAVKQYLDTMGIPYSFTATANPQANSPIERRWGPLRRTIAKWCPEEQGAKWPRYLRMAMWAHNATVNVATGCIPFELWYGREMKLPVEFRISTWREQEWKFPMTTEELVNARIRQLEQSELRVIAAADSVNRRRELDAETWAEVKRLRKLAIREGDMVLMWDATLEKQWSRKLADTFRGPYIVLRLGDRGVVWLAELDGTPLMNPVSLAHVVLFQRRNASLTEFRDKVAEIADLIGKARAGWLQEDIEGQSSERGSVQVAPVTSLPTQHVGGDCRGDFSARASQVTAQDISSLLSSLKWESLAGAFF